jgi:hypothetical protein
MTALLLSLALAFSPVAAPDPAGAARGCTSWSWSRPPSTVRILRSHKRGSAIPKRIEVWPTDRYITAVLASGASGNRVRESAKVMALMVRNWAVWQTLHRCRRWDGRRYDLTDGEQHLRRDVRPWSHLPVRTLAIVRSMRGVSITKNGHHLRLGWSGDGGRCGQHVDGYHVGEDGVRDCAERRHMGWRSILRLYLSPNLRIIGHPA